MVKINKNYHKTKMGTIKRNPKKLSKEMEDDLRHWYFQEYQLTREPIRGTQAVRHIMERWDIHDYMVASNLLEQFFKKPQYKSWGKHEWNSDKNRWD